MLWIVDENSGNRFEWDEAHTVRVYDVEGNNYFVFTIGDPTKETATLDEFKSAAMFYLSNYKLPDDVASTKGGLNSLVIRIGTETELTRGALRGALFVRRTRR